MVKETTFAPAFQEKQTHSDAGLKGTGSERNVFFEKI